MWEGSDAEGGRVTHLMLFFEAKVQNCVIPWTQPPRLSTVTYWLTLLQGKTEVVSLLPRPSPTDATQLVYAADVNVYAPTPSSPSQE